MVRVQVVNGARIDTYFGLRRSSFSASCSSTSRPPEACSVADAATTATMVSITSTGGLPGGSPKPKTSTHDADAAQQAQRDAALAGAVEQADQDDRELKREYHGLPLACVPVVRAEMKRIR